MTTIIQQNFDASRGTASRLQHYPVTFFAMCMGLFGFTLAVRAAETQLGYGHAISELLTGIAAAVFIAIVAGYALKFMRFRAAIIGEWKHPVRIAFFPAISISLLLMSAAMLEILPGVAHAIWLAGVGLQGALALSVVSAWIGHRPFQPNQLTPAWFIPAVGNVVVPLAGVQLGYLEISWLFFSAGLVFWLVLLTLVFNRLVFHDPLPGKMLPTLMILVAPPALGFIALLRLNGGVVDAFAHMLLSIAYVFAALVVTQLGKFRAVPFSLSWWALSFPLAALTVATFTYAGAAHSNAHLILGLLLLSIMIVVIGGLVARTVVAMKRREICVPEQ